MDASKLFKALAVGMLLVISIGCSSKGITKPRSEIVAQAQSDGLEVRSIEEDRQAFFEVEELNQQKLLRLIADRSSGSIRDANYRIGPSDELEIAVFDVPELNVTARVRHSGFISLPLIGAVQAAGLTEHELVDELTHRLAVYVRRPQVSVFISQFGSQKVAVMGAVRKPGTYSLQKGSNSILELLSEAGGISDKAGNVLTFIPAEFSGVSATSDSEQRARLTVAASDASVASKGGVEIYLDRVLGTSGGIPIEIPVRGGDMIIVPEAGKVMIEGEVQKPGSYDLNQQMTLLGALAASGGITYGAKVDEIEIVREISYDHQAHLVVNLEEIGNGTERDVKLRNGDIVRVPSDSGRRLTQDTFEGVTKLINFGIGGSVNMGR